MEGNKKERATARATQSQNQVNDTTKKPQWQVVLDELCTCGTKGITSWDMIVKHHITRTAAHICTLKKFGYEIVAKNETNNGVNYSRYWLVEDYEELMKEDEDEDVEVINDYVDEPWFDEDRARRLNEYEAYGAWLNR